MEFKQSDFDTVNVVMPSGKINEDTDVEIYWFNAISKSSDAFFQSRKLHRHNFFELHFILGGCITYTTKTHTVSLKAGDYVLFAPNQEHKIESHCQSLIKCSLTFTVGKEEAIRNALLLKCGEAKKITSELESSIRFIITLDKKQTPYYTMIVKNRLFEIIHSIAEDIMLNTHRDTSMKIINGLDLRVFKAKRFIRDNPNVFITCEDMAAYCYLSVKQLNRLFLKHEGISLLAYIHKEKLTLAKQLLKESADSLSEISDNLGFSSVYYFSNFFSKHEGITPGAYRKKGG